MVQISCPYKFISYKVQEIGHTKLSTYTQKKQTQHHWFHGLTAPYLMEVSQHFYIPSTPHKIQWYKSLFIAFYCMSLSRYLLLLFRGAHALSFVMSTIERAMYRSQIWEEKKSILYQIWFHSSPGFQQYIIQMYVVFYQIWVISTIFSTDLCSILPNLGDFYNF